ncbi:MAG TPA: ergothioneine biosynthesis protein EgtB, partial [Alcanivorax sp.]|nr:ergothioneine biosynthesis protein EgtB [Alcanivorax sp.]
MSQPETQPRHAGLARRLADTRAFSETLCEPLTAEDMGLQACPEVSPPRWHLAHTTWFFETFILKPFAPGYKPSDERFEYLFNSYYNGVGEQYPRPQRHLLSRPGNEAVRAWRASVDEAMQALLNRPEVADEVIDLVALGIEHEQQHQELLVTDLKFSFSHNPLAPVYRPRHDSDAQAPPLRWHEYPGGLTEIGADPAEGFCFDNETPRHRQWLEPFALASRPATCGEYLAFIEDGGY